MSANSTKLIDEGKVTNYGVAVGTVNQTVILEKKFENFVLRVELIAW